MEYFDEEVISAKHIKRRDEYGSIEEGLYIQNSLTLFHKELLFEEKLSVMMPNEFVIMLPELVDTKYISEKKPAYVFFEDKTIESVAGNSISLIQFKSYGIDEAAYNIIYLISIDKYIIQGAFNCRYDDMDEWKRAAFEMIKSIKVE